MSEKIRAVVVEESEQEVDEGIEIMRIKEIELKQEIYQKEVDEKFDKIFKCFGIQNNV